MTVNRGTCLSLDCEQSLFSSIIRGKERKTNKRASVTVNVTCERRCREPLVAWALRSSSNAHVTSGSRHRRPHVMLTATFARLLVLRSFPRTFEENRDCSQSSFSLFSFFVFVVYSHHRHPPNILRRNLHRKRLTHISFHEPCRGSRFFPYVVVRKFCKSSSHKAKLKIEVVLTLESLSPTFKADGKR